MGYVINVSRHKIFRITADNSLISAFARGEDQRTDMSEKIVITGLGAVTPVGTGTENYWQGLLSGRCGIGPITRIPADALAVKSFGEVKDFQPQDHIPARQCRELDRFMQFAFTAAEEALADSGLTESGDRVGIVMGTALAGLSLISDTQAASTSEGKKVGPRFVSMVMGNISASQFAIAHGITGPSLTVTTACSSGGDALKTAAMLLKLGEADVMVVMAGESSENGILIESLARAMALSKAGRSMPFGADRDGFVMGEGGGAIILETEEHALARGARIHAELLAAANTNDAYHTVSPEPDGSGAARCIRLALQEAGLAPEDIGYLNAHGTATKLGDVAETVAIHRVFGDCPVPVSSTKGATGHMMGAGGITELIACVKAIETGILPANTGMGTQDPACDLNIISAPVQSPIRTAMSNSLGFGGQNSSVILGRAEP